MEDGLQHFGLHPIHPHLEMPSGRHSYPLHNCVPFLVADGIVAIGLLEERRPEGGVEGGPIHFVLHVIVDQILQHSSLHHVVFVFI